MIGFDAVGRANTDATLAIALEAAEQYGIRCLVVASSEGETAKKLLGCGRDVVIVTHQAGFLKPGVQEFPEALRRELTNAGMRVLTTTHFFAGADRAVNRKFGGVYPAELMAHTLRILGQGFKVCVEVAVMALDAGFISPEEDVIAVGGTGRGADTAVILRPAHSQSFFDTDVKEILCMPRGHRPAPKPRFTLRPYRETDNPALAALFSDTVHTVNAADYTEEQRRAWTAGAADPAAWCAALPTHTTIVAEADGAVIGFGDITAEGHLGRLYVHRSHQREGIGTAICDALERAVSAETFTTDASITARPFFRGRGYRVVQPQVVYRQGVPLMNYRMEKP